MSAVVSPVCRHACGSPIATPLSSSPERLRMAAMFSYFMAVQGAVHVAQDNLANAGRSVLGRENQTVLPARGNVCV